MPPNTDSPKKTWIKPEIEILSKDIIQSGSVSVVGEGVPTTFGLLGSGS
jgi:hypothetical protein